jgi:hypothetical protein
MRAHSYKRFAIVIGAAAAGVMALGAQTATPSTGESVDNVPPDLQLSGPKRQSPQANSCGSLRCDLRVQASCGDEECTARANGKLTNVKNDKLTSEDPTTRVIAPGEAKKLWLPLSPSQRKQARKAIAEGEKVKAKVTVRASDAAGNEATAKRTIKIVK